MVPQGHFLSNHPSSYPAGPEGSPHFVALPFILARAMRLWLAARASPALWSEPHIPLIYLDLPNGKFQTAACATWHPGVPLERRWI